jgi:hypothetical protein
MSAGENRSSEEEDTLQSSEDKEEFIKRADLHWALNEYQ